jgi:Arc/MetJ-type ribon-helix-helix transcriptional regulator
LASDDLLTIGANVSKELAELLDCIVSTGKYASKSDILREALTDFMDNHLDKTVLENARKIQEMRRQTPVDQPPK